LLDLKKPPWQREPMIVRPPSADSFLALYNGRLQGMLTAELHAQTAAALPRECTWHLIHPQAQPTPTIEPLAGDVVHAQFLDLVAELAALHALHRGTGWTFVGEHGHEWLIKVFNPRQCGNGCGCYTPPVWRVYTTLCPSAAALAATAPPPPDPTLFATFSERARQFFHTGGAG